MARRDDTLSRAQRTRTGRVWTALIPAIAFLILLIIFIAENGQRVKVKYFGATGHISLAVALLVAAVAGAVVVLLIGGVRILQLRLAAWRHQRQGGATATEPTPAVGSVTPPPHEAQGVQPEDDRHEARP